MKICPVKKDTEKNPKSVLGIESIFGSRKKIISSKPTGYDNQLIMLKVMASRLTAQDSVFTLLSG